MSWKNEKEIMISVSVNESSILEHIAKIESLTEELQRECSLVRNGLRAKESSTNSGADD